MIRPFKLGDHLDIKTNEHSSIGDIIDVFFDDSFIKHSLDDDGEIKCIILWKQYSPRQYASFLLMPESISMKHVRALKLFIDSASVRLGAISCITYSVDCDMLNRWHKFLGFKQQRDSLLDQVKGFNKWVLRWE